MFVKNGIVYASDTEEEHRVAEARYLPYGMLLLTFSSGEKRLFDVTQLKGSAFAPLKEEEVRRSVRVFHGAVVWLDGEIDCSPEYLYRNSYAYNQEELVG